MSETGLLQYMQISDLEFQCKWILQFSKWQNYIKEHISPTFTPKYLLPFQLLSTMSMFDSELKGLRIAVLLDCFPELFKIQNISSTSHKPEIYLESKLLSVDGKVLATEKTPCSFTDKFPQQILCINKRSWRQYYPANKDNDFRQFISHFKEGLVIQVKITSRSVFSDTFVKKACLHHTSNLVKDLRKLETNGRTFGEVTFCVGRDKFRAHKLILSARSSVFQEMLKNDYVESVVTISECDSKMFGKFLTYIYSGEMEDKNLDTAMSLYPLAIKYQVHGLWEACFDIFETKFNCDKQHELIDSVCRILKLAHNHRDHALKDLSTYFIKSHFEDVGKSLDWIKLMRQDRELASEILNQVSQEKKGNRPQY